MHMLCTRSKTNLPVIAENGGGMSNTGDATIICGANGEALKPLFIPRGYSNGDHALFVAKPGMMVVFAGHDRSGESVSVNRIITIGTENEPDEIVLEKLYEYENGDGNIPEAFEAAAQAALEKSKAYHCRSPFYVAE
jgi:hypothetical protein